jgi:hypothetical protein
MFAEDYNRVPVTLFKNLFYFLPKMYLVVKPNIWLDTVSGIRPYRIFGIRILDQQDIRQNHYPGASLM